MNPIITYATPPLVGAFIGYLTNYVAIRMLFRPLQSLAALRPAAADDPGGHPRQKARSGRQYRPKMVGGHLLTGTDVQKALAEEAFRAELGILLSSRVATLLARDLGPLPTLVPDRFRSTFRTGIKLLRWRAQAPSSLPTWTATVSAIPSRHYWPSASTSYWTVTWMTSSRPNCAPGSSPFWGNPPPTFLTGPEVERWLVNYLDTRFGELLAQGTTPADLLPADLATELLDRLEAETPGLLQKLAALIREPLMQERIAGALCRVVDSFTAALGPMAALLGSFLNPEAIHGKIRDYLDRKGEEISDWLIDERSRPRWPRSCGRRPKTCCRPRWPNCCARYRRRNWPGPARLLAEKILQALRDPATGRALVNLINEALQAQQGRSLNETAPGPPRPPGGTRQPRRHCPRTPHPGPFPQLQAGPGPVADRIAGKTACCTAPSAASTSCCPPRCGAVSTISSWNRSARSWSVRSPIWSRP